MDHKNAENQHINVDEQTDNYDHNDEQSQVIKARFEKARQLADEGLDLYPNTFKPDHKVSDIKAKLTELTAEDLEKLFDTYQLAGRIMARRDYGKSAFLDIQDSTGRMQVYVQKQRVSPEAFDLFKKLDIGDFIGVKGRCFKTKTGELTILVEHLELVTKALWPLPEKFHEINVETKYRQRYLDLIMNEKSRKVFYARSKIISIIRSFMVERGFMEVETPMMHPIPGGASAKPFETFHNALDRTLFLRIAPELYLKRLLIGGFDRVFEINRSFRNEGLSVKHNPEFTMMEFYQSYANFEELMSFTEELFSRVALEVTGSLEFIYQGQGINFTGPWQRIRFDQSIVEVGGAPADILGDFDKACAYLKTLRPDLKVETYGNALEELFDALVEPKLINPTFVTHYPAEISPLAKKNLKEPHLTDRFELFIAGREMANAFSELNDPLDQRERFKKQAAEREAGSEESMYMDEDYIRALMYGMPPAAGEGVGIDRLVALLTDSPSIKDVILFPHMRPER